MDWRYKLLRIDSLGGLTVGLVMLLLSQWLSSWYVLPRGFIIFMGLVNLAYGCYSFSLLVKVKRPLSLIVVLVIANLGWAVLCVLWAVIFAQTASPFGTIHLLGEALFVGGLAYLEWRNRELLLTNPSRLEKNSVAEPN
jgi:predicted membrane-bound spermidine synthase